MPRNLVFVLEDDRTFECSVYTINRAKLYGVKEKEFIADGGACTLGALTTDGRHILPSGCTANGYLDESGNWIKKNELTPVDSEGKPIERRRSSFAESVYLEKQGTIEDVFDLRISLVYQLIPEDPAFLEVVKNYLYTFEFLSTEGYNSTTAYLVESGGSIFLLAGTPTHPEFRGYEEVPIAVPAEEEGSSDDLDFNMF